MLFVRSLLPVLALLPASLGASAQAPAPESPGSRSAAIAQPSPESLRKLLNTGHPQQALTALNSFPSTGAPAWVDRSRGLAYYALDQLQVADAAFARALTADPKDEESAQMRGLVLFRLGRPADAIPLLEGAHTWGPQSKADPTYVLALCYIDTRHYDEARHAFATQFGFPPDSAAAYLLAARMLLRREYLPVSQEFAQKALALEPSLPRAHALLGEIALAGNHTDDAVREFEAEKARNPLDGSLYERLGDAYSRAAKYSEAQRVLQQAVLLEPNSTGPYILLGKVMLKRDDAVAAATYLQKAERMDPANFMTHSLLAQADRALGRADDAARELATAQRIQAADEPKLTTLK